MASIVQSIANISHLEELAELKTPLHRLHPLAKLLSTFAFLMVTVSFDKYQLSRLFPLLLFPLAVLVIGEIPLKPILRRVLLASPFIIGIGMFNPLLDGQQIALLPGLIISAGWLSFAALMFKGLLTVSAALLLMATTGMGKIAQGLRLLGLPRIFVTQLVLTYRYSSVLMEEVSRILRAYALRSPLEKGVRFAVWGSLAGQLLLKTYDRADRVFQAMRCRGFAGDFPASPPGPFRRGDSFYLAGWLLYFMIIRLVDLPNILGGLLSGGIK